MTQIPQIAKESLLNYLEDRPDGYATRGSTKPPRPDNNAVCSACKHAFGDHFTSYNGKNSGCSHLTSYDDQRDGTYTSACRGCTGFQITYRFP